MVKKRIILGMSGATGQIYGIKMLEILKSIDYVETHLVLTDWARKNIELETDYTTASVADMADYRYDITDLGAAIASGSFVTGGMVVLPCSIKTLSAIVNSFNDNLLIRAADVTLKEKRPLILAVRETPLHTGHLRAMLTAAENGAVIFPPVPTFYNRPSTLDEMALNTVSRILDTLGVKNNLSKRWGEAIAEK